MNHSAGFFRLDKYHENEASIGLHKSNAEVASPVGLAGTEMVTVAAPACSVELHSIAVNAPELGSRFTD